jgi:acetoacetate decarboxylase
MADVSALKVWTLLDMDRISAWHKGRLVLLGDAAHPFLPHQGQGGGIAIEDAASLCALLPLGTTADDIPERLALYEKVRDERAHKVQTLTRIAGADLNDTSRGKFNSKPSPPCPQLPMQLVQVLTTTPVMEFMHYNFGHDEWHNSSRALKEHLWTRNGPVRWRPPLSFGPMPSPRQDHHGRPIPAHDSAFTTYSVRFKTSATYLKTLFPTPEFSFSSPGTVAEASFRCTELSKMRWLGGGGYKFLGLWIHGVQYARKDGSKVHGSFLVVLMESLADPIITGREELGMPKLFCDIDIAAADDKVGGSASIECSWRGQRFLRMHLDGLQQDEGDNGEPEVAVTAEAPVNPHAPPKPVEEGTIVYRYVPAVGKPGEADAAYAVLVREGQGSSVPRVVEKTCRTQDARLEFTEGDWETLPTFHHVAAGLAELPVYGIVEAKMEEGLGVDDLGNAERIE